MPHSIELRLRDVIDACDAITAYVGDLDLAGFGSDAKTRDAVIRQFEIAGEAVKALPENLTSLEPDVPWRSIAGFRDVLAHAYFAVDDSILWDAAVRRVPELRRACVRLLGVD
jgi:uncharacterized protein with HEPN domain